jgi:succinoglycan biosynthesis protein ExoO
LSEIDEAGTHFVQHLSEQEDAMTWPVGALAPGGEAWAMRSAAQTPFRENRGGENSVSVVIAAYNAATFLARAVMSALRQTCPPLEVIIVDDASSDDTVAVARELTARDARVRVLRLDANQGPAAARNVGFDSACGQWIAVLDADDAFLPDRLERLLRIAGAWSADIVADNFIWYAAEGQSMGSPGLAPSSSTELVDAETFVSAARPFGGEADWGLLKPMFRAAFLRSNELRYPTKSRHGEDFLFMMEALLAGGRYVLGRAPGYLYTARSSGLSRTKIDYDTMAAHTLRLARDRRVCSRPRLKALLRRRYAAVRRLSAETKIALHRRERHIGRTLIEMFKDRYFSRAVLSIVRSNARRWVARLETAFR